MERKEYIEPSYEVLLLNSGSVITESGTSTDPWEGGHMPLGSSWRDE